MKTSGFVVKLNLAVFVFVAFAATTVAAQQKSWQATTAEAVAFIEKYEPELERDLPDAVRVNAIDRLLRASYRAGDAERVKKYSAELLDLSAKFSKPFELGSAGLAIHSANIALGLTAIDDGDLSAAKNFLISAASIQKADPVLSSFGPNMLLAKRLLDAGERQAVLRYFELCETFWASGKQRLNDWKLAVSNNKTPDFGAAIVNFTDSWRYHGCSSSVKSNGVVECPGSLQTERSTELKPAN